MATQESLERARKLVKPHCTESDDHDYQDCRKCEQMAEEIAVALDAAGNEALEKAAQRCDELAENEMDSNWSSAYKRASMEVRKLKEEA